MKHYILSGGDGRVILVSVDIEDLVEEMVNYPISVISECECDAPYSHGGKMDDVPDRSVM